MKNKGLLNRRAIPLGQHKQAVPAIGACQIFAGTGGAIRPAEPPSRALAAAPDAAGTTVPARNHDEATAPDENRRHHAQGPASNAAKAESSKRYTLILKVASELAARVHFDGKPPSVTLKRAMFTVLRDRIIAGAGQSRPHSPDETTAVRADLRLPDSVVAKIVLSERLNQFEAPSSVLGRFASGYFAELLEELPDAERLAP
ncbi:hypothetical protein [Phaeovulum sp. W22_SRMD_FR3]|uniref:hypothetical protein n=1 Tax=Phaeovulum sp. W22_SRMD_FR3 TaxID=3240274 RepID=UPI003F9457F7